MSSQEEPSEAKREDLYLQYSYDVGTLSQAKTNQLNLYSYPETLYSLNDDPATTTTESEETKTNEVLERLFRDKFAKLVEELEVEFPKSKNVLKNIDQQVMTLVKKILTRDEVDEQESKFFWQREFSKGRRLSDVVEKADKLYSLGVDMTTMCSKYAEIIILEETEKGSDKTIQSVDVGGVAGGEKFIIR
jgi:hypothetical protein